MAKVSELAPKEVWEHFDSLCNIPRPSKHEEKIRAYVKKWAEDLGLKTHEDQAGNLIIKKPASKGMENRTGVVLQGHLDMVCQANQGTEHDFFKDPIRPVVEDGWLIAKNTTLGADNGVGVALAMAVLASKDIPHGPIEALFTVDEEAGMGGAQGLEGGLLDGELLINIDTEEWGEFYLGCAGGEDVNVSSEYQVEALPAGYELAKVTVKGLVGGHSGADIHKGRGNAIKVLVRFIQSFSQDLDIRVVELEGGSARNALAREAHATIAIPSAKKALLAQEIQGFEALMKFELGGVDENIVIELSDAPAATQVMVSKDQTRLLGALQAAPHGVKRMSLHVDGVVETSNNLGVVSLKDGKFFANLMVRSLLDSGTKMQSNEIISLFTLAGCDIQREGAYPGWAPNPNSNLLKLFQEVYKAEFDKTAEVRVIHAGLECGLLGSKYPNMDMISFGPDIRGAHAPGEKVRIESVEKTWDLLKAVLKAIPAKH